MYRFKKELKMGVLDGRTIVSVARKIGVNSSHLIMILNGKRVCSKLVAYCITKGLNSDSEINDYFIRED